MSKKNPTWEEIEERYRYNETTKTIGVYCGMHGLAFSVIMFLFGFTVEACAVVVISLTIIKVATYEISPVHVTDVRVGPDQDQ